MRVKELHCNALYHVSALSPINNWCHIRPKSRFGLTYYQIKFSELRGILHITSPFPPVVDREQAPTNNF